MHHRLLLIALLLSLSFTLRAQYSFYEEINQGLPPSPTSASLGQYGDFEINGYTGVPGINVPLATVQLKDFSLPITLSYNATGIKVEDIASWVGQGWSLNAGGVVTRTVQDLPDDLEYGMGQDVLGQLYNNWYIPGYNPNWSVGFRNGLDPFGGTTDVNASALLGWMRFYVVDTEPDIFFYDINGETGRFMYDTGFTFNPGRLVMTPYRDILIEMDTTGANNIVPNTASSGAYFGMGAGNIKQFVITTERGDKYYFGAAEGTVTVDQPDQATFFCEYCNPSGPSNDLPSGGGGYKGGMYYLSSWYPSKIITASGEEIDYTYADEMTIYTIPNSTSLRYYQAPMGLTDAQGCALTTPEAGNGEPTFMEAWGNTNVTVYSKRLTGISGPNFSVVFNANLARQDLLNNHALTSVQLFSGPAGNQSLVKQFNLTYGYMADLSQPQLQSGIAASYSDSRQHLLLDSLYLVDQNGVNLGSYNFQYNNTYPLPDRLSPHKDFWGYFCNNSCGSAIPKLYIYPNITFNADEDSYFTPNYSVFPYTSYTGLSIVLPGANRNTDPVGILSGTLNKIVFPTGGSTSFTFEPHTFNYLGMNLVGGGLRLKQQVSYDGINHANDVVTNYSYLSPINPKQGNSSGVLFNLPMYAYAENAFTHYNGTGTTVFDAPDTEYYKMNFVRTDVSQASLNGFDGVNVGYRYITTSQPGNGQTVRTYSVPGYYGQISDFQNDGGCSLSQSGFCDGYFQAPLPENYPAYNPCTSPGCTNTALTLDLEGMGNDIYTPYNFPFAPLPNYDWNRGLLQQESVYNNTGTLLKQTNYQYALFTPHNTGVRVMNSLKKGRLLNNGMTLQEQPGGFYESIDRYDVLEPYTLIGQVCKVPLSMTTYDYDVNSPGSYVSDSVVYGYSYNSLAANTETHFESDGSVSGHYTRHVADVDTSQATTIPAVQGYYTMLRNHKLYSLVEDYHQVTRGGTTTTVSGTAVTYQSTIPEPAASFDIETPSPLTNFTPSTISATNFNLDSRYQPLILFDQYDAGQNMLQQHKNYDQDVSFIWDYKGQYTIAQVMGGAQSDIAYTSFEADGTGNWIIPNPSLNKSAAFTGNNSFNMTYSTYIANTSLNAGTTYILSYWSQNGPLTVTQNGTTGSYAAQAGATVGPWTYYEHQVSGTSEVSMTGQATIDELRLYPKGALMVTFTYNPQVGMTTQCDASNKVVYYTYDTFGRLKMTKDQYGNILKDYNYEYQATNN